MRMTTPYIVQIVFGPSKYPIRFHDPKETPGRNIYSTCAPGEHPGPTQFETREEARKTARARLTSYDEWEVTPTANGAIGTVKSEGEAAPASWPPPAGTNATALTDTDRIAQGDMVIVWPTTTWTEIPDMWIGTPVPVMRLSVANSLPCHIIRPTPEAH